MPWSQETPSRLAVGETDNGTNDIWWILEGQDYPHLWWEDDD